MKRLEAREVEMFVDKTKPSFSHQAQQDASQCIQCVTFDESGTMITNIRIPRKLPITKPAFLAWLKVSEKDDESQTLPPCEMFMFDFHLLRKPNVKFWKVTHRKANRKAHHRKPPSTY